MWDCFSDASCLFNYKLLMDGWMDARIWAVIASSKMLHRVEWKIVSENNAVIFFMALAGPSS